MADYELFQTYEADFQIAYEEAQEKLNQIRDLDGEPRKSAMKAVERATDECYEIIDQMSIEVQNISSSERSSFNSKIRSYRSSVEKQKIQLKKLMDDEDRRILFGSSPQFDYNNNDPNYSQRQSLLRANASLERSSDRLRDSQRIGAETENIGAGILNDLRGQREQIINSRNTLMDADGYVDKSIRTLRKMTRRMATNKMITYAIIAVLIILIFLVLLSKFW
ncbi:v-SNARE protein VTI1 [Ascoidea rubescens DSM 1968]|uniref:V-snare-domain-containing protein n=1 Tax=Ascoidea rubescens DSM 1968 TaxID=1344418 RepID=A0A1D2VB00_9ASCO|nr:V-snare-domain-containing protein [Ascoidea rubescens DSM 1968]ODV58633.1 V-snare-domain-containing protein [Ascoidea rubescens DSM 1968]